MSDLIPILLLNPPDPLEPLPLSNKKETIYGATLPFLVVAWMAVGMRLWVRCRIVREPGLDDLFVVLAAIGNTVATAFVLKSIDYGFGQHMLYLSIDRIENYVMAFYVENALYITETALIKISLLLQYLRIFKAGAMRWVCIALLVTISLWGLGYSFIAWVPCFPVKAYWQRTRIPGKCYGFGFTDVDIFVSLFKSHTALNMVFDAMVFVTPMILFTQAHLRLKNVLAMTGVFLFGSVVVFTSAWRLYSIVLNRAATYPYIDFTWWPPISVILSCLEISLAIICASMPIFWPVVEKSLSQIFVTHEVHIVEEHRTTSQNGLAYELEHADMKRKGSIMSTSGHSRENLTRQNTARSGERDIEGYYNDQYISAHVDPFSGDDVPGAAITVETSVDADARPKPKWNI